jgi:hypothetical protein
MRIPIIIMTIAPQNCCFSLRFISTDIKNTDGRKNPAATITPRVSQPNDHPFHRAKRLSIVTDEHSTGESAPGAQE